MKTISDRFKLDNEESNIFKTPQTNNYFNNRFPRDLNDNNRENRFPRDLNDHNRENRFPRDNRNNKFHNMFIRENSDTITKNTFTEEVNINFSSEELFPTLCNKKENNELIVYGESSYNDIAKLKEPVIKQKEVEDNYVLLSRENGKLITKYGNNTLYNPIKVKKLCLLDRINKEIPILKEAWYEYNEIHGLEFYDYDAVEDEDFEYYEDYEPDDEYDYEQDYEFNADLAGNRKYENK